MKHNYLKTLKLLLPALIPSWRFFDRVAPSPRIEFSLLKIAQDGPESWQEFRPRPARLTCTQMLGRLFWNPTWNESLFLVSCAERLIQNPTEHSEREIANRIKAGLEREAIAAPYLQFRLAFVNREGAELQKRVDYISPVHRYPGGEDA